MKDKYYKADFFQTQQKERDNNTLKKSQIFVPDCQTPKVRLTNTISSNVFNMQPEDKQVNVRSSNSFLNTYRMGSSQIDNGIRVRTSNNTNSSLFDKQGDRQVQSRQSSTYKSQLFEKKYSTDQFKKQDYVYKADEHKNNYNDSQEAFKRRLMEVYGKEGTSNKKVDGKIRRTENKTNHQRKMEEHYMNDVLGEQKNIECEQDNQKKHTELMKFNNNDRHVRPDNHKEYHHQKKYHDLYSTYVIDGQQKDNKTDELKKNRVKWVDIDHDNQRKQDQNYSNMFGKESQGKVRPKERTDDHTAKDNWQNREQKTDNSGKNFHSAFSNKQKDLSSSILGKNYMNQFLQNRVSTPQEKKYFYQGGVRSGIKEIKQNELKHMEPFMV